MRLKRGTAPSGTFGGGSNIDGVVMFTPITFKCVLRSNARWYVSCGRS